MKNDKPLDFKKVGELDELAEGLFVQPTPSDREKADEVMKKFIKTSKSYQTKSSFSQ